MATGKPRAEGPKPPPPGGQPVLHLSTEGFPESERAGIFREVFGRQMFRIDFEPLSTGPFHAEIVARSLPGLDIVWAQSSPMQTGRTAHFIQDGNDNIVFQWATSPVHGSQLGRTFELRPGDAVALSNADANSVTFPSGVTLRGLNIPRAALTYLLRDGEDCIARTIPGSSEPLQLLARYLEILRPPWGALATPELSAAMASHIHDLVALALGASRDAGETARRRGRRAARLQTIKTRIRENLADGDLSLPVVAAWHKLTPRYVQMLFEDEGTSFTEFLRGERLAAAYRMLASPRFHDKRIADVAFECGFGDISHFNHAFRARYGATPSDIRNINPL